MAALFVLGILVGVAINWAVYALAWFSRPISPWQRRHADAPARQWSDFIPISGWLGLARESAIHGRGFWVRPLLIELACGLGLLALYAWETAGELAPSMVGVVPPTALMLHHEFVSHAILIAFM